ncbi:mucin-5AC-like isoform X1 [Schistocerca nitens]|uniref:mucin-5AC-like isoform X1 n=1 Tax=Schistocerca nitens TaxID=7011 RepID=UPI002118A627|nr:mucin-5AC-like isoform X1 [Schistocerca nitens]
MARQQCWLILAACALSAIVTWGSARTANDDGICIRVTQYVAGEGKRAIDGTTLTYCAGERDCRKTADQVCCNGWRRDPDSKKLRCIKIISNDSALDIYTDLGSAEDSRPVGRFENALKKEAGVQKNVRRPRGSPSSPENTSPVSPLVNIGHSEANVPSNGSVKVSSTADDHSVQDRQQASQNASPDVAAKGNGKTGTGALKSNPTNSPAIPAVASSGTGHTLTNGKQPVEPPGSSANNTQSEPNAASSAQLPVTATRDAPHSSTEKQSRPSESHTEVTGTNQESSKNGPASAHEQSNTISSQVEEPHGVQPVVVHAEPKNDGSSPSKIGHSEVDSQTPAMKEHSDQHGDTTQTRGPAGPVRSSVATASTAASGATTSMTSQPPVPITDLTVATSTSRVQPQGGQTVTSLSPSISHSVDPVTTVSSVSTTPSEGRGSASPSGQSNNHPTASGSVVHVPMHSDQDISSTNQSAQDTGGPLTLTSEDLAHGRHEDTIPSPGTFQSTSAPPTPVTTMHYSASTTTATSTNVSASAAVSTNTTGAAASQPQGSNGTHVIEKGTLDNTVHGGPSAPLEIATTASNQTITHAGTTPASAGIRASVPVLQHPNVHTGNINAYNVTVETKSGNGSKTQGASAGDSSATAGQQGGTSAANSTEKNGNGTSIANCSLAEPLKNCNNTNDTAPTVTPQSSTAPPVAKPLGDKARAGTALPSGRSASKTASEVTISLLLVAAVAFVVALLYWRSRRRRRRYINCGTREPNLHFSNPVYDLEAMMEQTSLVKLQNAADVEDGDLEDSDRDATFQRK